jgi:hypothetical protein
LITFRLLIFKAGTQTTLRLDAGDALRSGQCGNKEADELWLSSCWKSIKQFRSLHWDLAAGGSGWEQAPSSLLITETPGLLPLVNGCYPDLALGCAFLVNGSLKTPPLLASQVLADLGPVLTGERDQLTACKAFSRVRRARTEVGMFDLAIPSGSMRF